MEHLEGKQSVMAALLARQRRFQVILVRRDAHAAKVQDVLDLAADMAVPVRHVERAELDALAHGATHGGVVAICGPKPMTSAEELLELIDGRSEPALLLLLEGVEDARNLGFTLRSAEALGAQAVLVKKHLWDLDTVEIARPASGAFERVPVVQVESVDVIQQLRRRGLRLLGCLAGAKRTVYECDLTAPVILAIGGEKRGLSGAVREICDGFLTIPTCGGASSLSLSHAGAIVLAEAMRQRLARKVAWISPPSTVG